MTDQQENAATVLLASAASTIVSRAATYPPDTLKARLQVQGALPNHGFSRNTFQAAAQMWRQEGLRSFYRGFPPSLAGVLPASAVYFFGYETAKNSQVLQQLGPLTDFAVGCIAQLSAGLIYTPTDIVKERLQVQSLLGKQQISGLSILSSLVAQRGILGLFRGYWITNSVWIPWTSIYIASYEASKRRVSTSLNVSSPQKLPSWAVATCSGGAAAFAALLTHPLDVVKTRFQVLTANDANLTVKTAFKDLWLNEGARGLMQGLSARMLQIAPGAAISWLVYEKAKQMTNE